MSAGARLGDWVLDEPLGQGGMGTVYRCHDARTGQPYAIKLLGNAADPELRLRFQREGEAQARVDRHPHVLRIHSAGEHGGRPFLVMDLASGGDLLRRIRARGALDPLLVARMGADLASGLAHVHAQGVLHRDLKPQNVLFDEHDRPQLVDFGLAHLTGGQSLTEPGELLGTPAYMSPEQAQGRGVDARSDVYGLGAVLYHAATGQPPYHGKTIMAVLEQLGSGPPPAPSQVRPGLPEDLDHVLRRAMARSSARRYPSAAAFAADLQRVAEGRRPAFELQLGRGAWLAAAVGVALLGGLLAWSGRAPSVPAPAPATPAPPPTASPTATPSATASPQAPPPLEEVLRELRRQAELALGRVTPESQALSSLEELRFLIDGAFEADSPVAWDRSLALVASRLRARQARLTPYLTYDDALVRRLHEASVGTHDPVALHELGSYLLRYGERTPADLQAALAALKEAAAAGFPSSQRLLARELLKTRDPVLAERARLMLEQAASQSREAKVLLAELLLPVRELRELVTPDPERAVRLLQEAAEEWSLQAVKRIAEMHLEGRHLARDPDEAIRLLRAAVERDGSGTLVADLGDALRSQDDRECVAVYERGLRLRSSVLLRRCHAGLEAWYAAHGDPQRARQHHEARAAISHTDADDDDDPPDEEAD